MITFLCPHCNTQIPAEARAIGSLPPTGGDYEWQEGEKSHTCPNCQNTFEMRVRTSIETSVLLFINQSPKPRKADMVWYAVGNATGNTQEKSVYVSIVCQTEAEAQAKLLDHSQRHYQPLYVFKLTSEGYFDQNNHLIQEPSYYADVINYLEIR